MRNAVSWIRRVKNGNVRYNHTRHLCKFCIMTHKNNITYYEERGCPENKGRKPTELQIFPIVIVSILMFWLNWHTNYTFPQFFKFIIHRCLVMDTRLYIHCAYYIINNKEKMNLFMNQGSSAWVWWTNL